MFYLKFITLVPDKCAYSIIAAPSIDMDLNATVYTSDGQDLTPSCELEYEVEMIYSTQIMVTTVNALLHDGTLCGANTEVHITWIETEFIVSGNRVNVLHGIMYM